MGALLNDLRLGARALPGASPYHTRDRHGRRGAVEVRGDQLQESGRG